METITAKTPWAGSMGSMPMHLDYFEGSMFEAVEAIAEKYPNYVAFDFMGKSTTYKKLVQEVETCAKALKTIGVREGDKVTIAMPNCPQAIYLFYAINLVGGVAEVDISERQEGEEIVESNEPCNVVAARGGQIVRMEVYDGQRVRQNGETVKKGDLLVSGVVANSKNKTILRHAEAKVLAEYSQSHEVSVPLTQTLKVPQGGMENYRYLNIGPLRLPLFIVGAGEWVTM